MKGSTIIGTLLIALGVAALVYKSFSYKSEETVFQLGSLKATAEMEKTVEIPDIASVLAIVGGVIVIVLGSRRK